ncbi:MAG: hypothetical protein ACE14S_11605 [Candidatus Bathyarchaeia archaeon]
MKTNKLLTTAITAFLILSTFALSAPALAINQPSFYRIGATVTGPVSTGNVGERILVNGTGGTAFGPISVYWDAINVANLLASTNANNLGVYAANVTIPSATNGVHFIIVYDNLAGSVNSATFLIVPSLSAGTPPVRVLPGDALVLVGHGFAASSVVTVIFGSTVIVSPAIATNTTGSFSAVITVPVSITPAQFDTYTITANDAVIGSASVNVSVDYYVTVTPTSGPPGITITIATRGPAANPVTVTFGSAVAFTGTSDGNGLLTGMYALTGPIILGTAYPITATWGPVGSQVSKSTTFTVNPNAPTISFLVNGVGVTSAPVGTQVTVLGQFFSANAMVTLSFSGTVLNSTAMDSRFGPTDSNGAFTGEFTVPNVVPGPYAVTVTDQYNSAAGATFTVVVTPAIGSGTIGDFNAAFRLSFARMIYPADTTPKPLGAAAASVSDWLASMAVSTKLTTYTEGLDTSPNFVNPATGKALGSSGTGIISFGGPIVNPIVKYAEAVTTNAYDRAPIKFQDGGDGNFYFRLASGAAIPGANLPVAVVNHGDDLFVIETYHDLDGRTVMLCYGFGWQGTYAAGKYFDRVVYPNLGLFNYNYIIVRWQDTNANGFVNNPGDGDIYTVIASGLRTI